MKLYIKELTFEAAHYLRNHPTCGCPHGHTYFIRNLMIVGDVGKDGMVLDFGKLKDYFKRNWDHKFLVPSEDAQFWEHVYDELELDCSNLISLSNPTVEELAGLIKYQLIREFEEILYVSFELYEGLNQGVAVESQ